MEDKPPFQFKNPIRRSDPFVGPDGQNPFQEQQATNPEATNPEATNPEARAAEPGSATPFAAPHASSRPDAREIPDAYQAVLPSRGPLLMTLATFSAVFCLSGIVMTALVGLYAQFGSVWETLLLTPLVLAGIVLALPAWLMAQSDLRAIRHGAMVDTSIRTTRRARAIAAITALGTLFYCVLFIGTIVVLGS